MRTRATDEIKHIVEWARINKLIINIKKTKEIVVRRARSRSLIIPPPVNGIEQVESVKLLGVTFNSRFSFTSHIDFIAATCSQRFYLLKQMRSQGLDKIGEQIIFNALVVLWRDALRSANTHHTFLTKITRKRNLQ